MIQTLWKGPRLFFKPQVTANNDQHRFRQFLNVQCSMHLIRMRILITESTICRECIDKAMVRLAGIEPTTLGFGGQYSIH